MAARIGTDGFVDPCVPTLAAKPPSGPDRVDEIRQDGYRLIVRLDGAAVRILPRRGSRPPPRGAGGSLRTARRLWPR